jgi:hypothetical protein
LAEFVELTIEQGATFTTEVTVNDANGDPKDLTDYEVRSQIRKSYYSSTSTSFDITIDDVLGGIITMGMSANTTSNINPGRYVYDVVIEDTNSGVITRIFEGIATVLPNVTR